MSSGKPEINQQPPPYQGGPSGGTQPVYQTNAPAGMQPPPPPTYQQPAPGYYGGQQTTVIMSQPVGFGNQAYGPNPASLQCPHCSMQITTSTSKHCNGMLWLVAGVICLIGLGFPLLWLGCCLIPFCIPSLYDVRHTCPNCQRELGQFKPGGI